MLIPSIHLVAAALLLGGPAIRPRRSGPPAMVSERHNQAYKETIKSFAAMNASSPLRPFASDELSSHTPLGEMHLVHESTAPLVTEEECAAVVQESEEWARGRGGWTSTRHFNHPTTDIPLQELPRTRAWFNGACLDRLYPFLAASFADALPNPRALRVADAFVVKYNASGGQTFLAPHRDGSVRAHHRAAAVAYMTHTHASGRSVVSFNIALNRCDEYEGGGTWFEGLGRSIQSERGHVLAHASGCMHGGHPITSGVRYILVAFVIVEGYAPRITAEAHRILTPDNRAE